MNANCILHQDRPSTHHMNVPCAEDGKVGLCSKCNEKYQARDPHFMRASFEAYRNGAASAKGQRIAQFKRLN